MELEFSKNPFKLQDRIYKLRKEVVDVTKKLSEDCKNEGIVGEVSDQMLKVKIEPLQAELSILESQLKFAWQFWATLANIVVALVALISLYYSIKSYLDAVKLNSESNRPYLDLDKESIGEYILVLPVQSIEKSLQFSLKNYGTLPAKYVLDFSSFVNGELDTISHDCSEISFLYPDQANKVTCVYDQDMSTREERLNKFAEELRSLSWDWSKVTNHYAIKIKYGFVYQKESELPYELTVRRKYFSFACENKAVSSSSKSCMKYKWVVESVK